MLHSSLRTVIRRTSGPSRGLPLLSTAQNMHVRTFLAPVTEITPTDIEPLTFSSHPFDGVCHMLEAIHTMADVPYFGAIILGTIGVRTLLLPLTITVMKNGAKMQIAAPEIEKCKKLLDEKKNGTEEERKAILAETMEVYKKHDVNPMRSVLLPFFQMPIFISMFFGIQRMGDYFPGFATGGYGWFENLSATDPTYILPALNGLTFLLVSETNSDLDTAQHGPMMRNMFRAMAVGMPFVTASFPQVFMLCQLSLSS
jgi:YidC/Oxa1 family membrane protein insertase